MMYECESDCVCGMKLVACELEARNRIAKHHEEYKLPFDFPSNRWPSRCRRCGRTYMVENMNAADESVQLYPWFFYHTIISWNQLRRRESNFPSVTIEDVRRYWQHTCPEIDWDAGMENAWEYDQKERKHPNRSFVFGVPWYKLQKGHPFRKENDLALNMPFLE